MSWESWEISELGRWEKWERCVSGLGWQGGKGERIVRWHDPRGGNVMGWTFRIGGVVVIRQGGMEFKYKIMLYCSTEVKDKQGFTAGIS